MTLTNGDATSGTSQLLPEQRALDYTRALEVLEQEYKNSDGLDARTLLDSRINGGLTYNDFLVLPGYIGTSKSRTQARVSADISCRLCFVRCLLGHSCH